MQAKAPVIPPPPSIDVCAAAGTGTDYSNRDLHDTNFHSYQPGSLRYANFDHSDLRGANFGGQDLTGASFRGATLGKSDTGPAVFTHTVLDKTCFSGAKLNDAQFAFARFHCADFSNTVMIDAMFGPRQTLDHAAGCRTRFIGATLDVHAITRDHWPFADFTDAKFKNYTPANFTLAGLDLTGVMLARTVLPGIDMTASNLTSADLAGAKFVGGVFESATFNGATLVGTDFSSAHLRCARFRGSKGDAGSNNSLCQANPDSTLPLTAADLTNVQLRDSDLERATLNDVQMRGAILDRVTATHASFVNASFIADAINNYGSASFVAANLTQAIFTGAKLQGVKFKGTILPGADFSGTDLQGTSFDNASAPGATFANATLEGVSFQSASLQSASFAGATLQLSSGPLPAEVDFTCAQLGGSDFTGADVKQANFNSAVMPVAADCCPATTDSGSPICGTVELTGLYYGPTKVPTLTATNDRVTCPNGAHAPCDGWGLRLPNWRTTDCNAKTSDGTIWTKPSCGGTSAGDVVTFEDDNLRRCVSDSLPGNPTIITKSLAGEVSDLDCSGRGIQRLGGLAAFTALKSLDLSNNQLQQLVVALAELSKLKIARNQLATLDVSQLPALRYLDASKNHLQSVTFGQYSPAYLDLSQNQLINVDLAVLENLRTANLSSNQLTTVTDSDNPTLSRASYLAYLDLSNNTLTTMGTLQNNPALSALFLGCNPQFHCATLGVDPSSAPIQTSQCSVQDKVNPDHWTMLTNPPPCQ